MAATTLARRAAEPPVLARLKTDPAFQAFWMMRIGFTAVPILFGVRPAQPSNPSSTSTG